MAEGQVSAEQLAALAAEDTGDEDAAAEAAAAAAAKAGANGKGEGDSAAEDWRASLKSADAKKFAESSPDVEHAIGRALAFQKQLSTAIVPLAKDAPPEALAAYRKQTGVPATAEGYKFAMPEGMEAGQADKAFQGIMAKAFHDSNVPAATAEALTAVYNELTKAGLEAQVQADKKFADESNAELRKAWPGAEYDKNKAHADRAAAWMFGDQVEEIRHLETKDGRFIMDHPIMLRALAATGREMAEGGLVPPMSGDGLEQAQDELTAVRAKIVEAQGRGDSKEANRLYGQEQALLAKMGGNRPIVGSAGRAA